VLTNADVRNTTTKAIAFLKRAREPHALLFMGLIHRRLGIPEFADSLAR
jgi:hypothetical protein